MVSRLAIGVTGCPVASRECVARLPHEEVKVLRCMYLDPHGTISVRSWNTTAQSIHSGRAGYIRSLRVYAYAPGPASRLYAARYVGVTKCAATVP